MSVPNTLREMVELSGDPTPAPIEVDDDSTYRLRIVPLKDRSAKGQRLHEALARDYDLSPGTPIGDTWRSRCGGATNSGKACLNSGVWGDGRCWQHQGQRLAKRRTGRSLSGARTCARCPEVETCHRVSPCAKVRNVHEIELLEDGIRLLRERVERLRTNRSDHE